MELAKVRFAGEHSECKHSPEMPGKAVDDAEAVLKALANPIEWQTPWSGGDDLEGYVEGVQSYFVECYYPQEDKPWRIEYKHLQKGWLSAVERETGDERRTRTREAACELCLQHWTTGQWI